MHSCAYVSVVYCNGCVVAVGKHSIIIIIIIITITLIVRLRIFRTFTFYFKFHLPTLEKAQVSQF